MKKLFALGFLSLAALGWATDSASAWWPCFPMGCGKCGNCCTTTICLRQYNAFTPICCGNLNCDGCCPLMGMGGCGMGMGMGGCGYGPGMAGCGPAGCYGAYGATGMDGYPMGMLPAPGTISTTTQGTPVMNANPALQVPAPAQAPAAGQPIGAAPAYRAPRYYLPAAPVQPVTYQQPYFAPAPWYWTPNGR